MINPASGTCLDKGLVEFQDTNQYDFFLIAHNATVATALPVHYKVVANSTGLNQDRIETFTYHLCHQYFNFAGPIKVPAATMYAGKVANYATENRVTPSQALSLNLHFL